MSVHCSSVPDTAAEPCPSADSIGLLHVARIDKSPEVPSDFGIFPQEMDPDESQRYAEGPFPTDAQPDRECLAQKEVCDEILLSKTLPCTAGKDICNVGLEGFGNTSTSVDDTNWMPISSFPPSMPALPLPPNESYGAEMSISAGPNMAEECQVVDDTPLGPN